MWKKTWNKIAKLASKTLRDKNSSKIQKSIAWSVLSQSKTNKVTSEKIEKLAQNVLLSKESSNKTKKLAWSALSQSD